MREVWAGILTNAQRRQGQFDDTLRGLFLRVLSSAGDDG